MNSEAPDFLILEHFYLEHGTDITDSQVQSRVNSRSQRFELGTTRHLAYQTEISLLHKRHMRTQCKSHSPTTFSVNRLIIQPAELVYEWITTDWTEHSFSVDCGHCTWWHSTDIVQSYAVQNISSWQFPTILEMQWRRYQFPKTRKAWEALSW